MADTKHTSKCRCGGVEMELVGKPVVSLNVSPSVPVVVLFLTGCFAGRLFSGMLSSISQSEKRVFEMQG